MQHGQRIAPGRVVHFVMGNGDIRAAQVIRIWGSDPAGSDIQYPQGYPEGMYPAIQLMVTLDGTNDTQHYRSEKEIVEWIKRVVTPEEKPEGWSKRKAILDFLATNPLASDPIYSLYHWPDQTDPEKDQLVFRSVVTVNGWHGWASSVSYDPYDWKPRTWHWPQDKKLTKPQFMEPVVSV